MSCTARNENLLFSLICCKFMKKSMTFITNCTILLFQLDKILSFKKKNRWVYNFNFINFKVS
jgi:hypothetical protein